ncbi:hypothetical protein [Tsuneonella amylolytica]|uniref:hypothetical protein n=1 Tax=Tsuneonella amylolytica TaxID=2338327 RepID=UPI000EA89AD9|nr:hypothetical protein [Tsuneonella amylolytica]
MRLVVMISALVLLASCGEPEVDPVEKARQDEADIAAVKAAEVPPPVPVTPETIGAPDVERYDLYGAGCNFAPKGSIGAVAFAQPGRGYMKIDGKLVTFAPDIGSGTLPLGAKGKYTAGAWSFMLDLSEEEGEEAGSEVINYPAQFILRNDRDQVVYESPGIAQCGS